MSTEPNQILTITDLNQRAKSVLETHIGQVWVMGEISNLARPASGHLYFTLKDEQAQVRCALFRMSRRGIDFPIENGQQVLAYASVSLYPGRGDYQLIVTQLQLAGAGALQLAFEQTKKRLAAEGLFDDSHKQPLPIHPQQIGVITSSTGAAIRDILKVLKRRNPMLPVIIYPTLVQGDKAKETIVKAIEIANTRAECDVLLLSRGGGSLEDLWPFNEECVARAIFNSQIPIISGVGHEVDFTIADFVADIRAATPSAAAETVSEDQNKLLQTLSHLQTQLHRLMTHRLTTESQQLETLKHRLKHPKDKLQEQAQKLDHLEHQLISLMKAKLQQSVAKIDQLTHRLPSPQHHIAYTHEQVNQLNQRLSRQIQQCIKDKHTALNSLKQTLNTLSPLATLERGYAIVSDQAKQTVTSVQSLKAKASIQIQLKDGSAQCEVISTQT